MDLTQTIAPRSDQINADDLIGGPVTVTVERVTAGAAEQPIDVHLVESPGRAYRPSKSMRRVLVIAWGKESDAYVGRRMTLYRDPEVRFGADKVGGVKISHLSDIDKPLTMMLTATRGKRAAHVVKPLTESAPTPALDIATTTDRAALKAAWRAATPEVRAQIEARVAELDAAAETLPIEADQ